MVILARLDAQVTQLSALPYDGKIKDLGRCFALIHLTDWV